jgi:hypothetical protein
VTIAKYDSDKTRSQSIIAGQSKGCAGPDRLARPQWPLAHRCAMAL